MKIILKLLFIYFLFRGQACNSSPICDERDRELEIFESFRLKEVLFVITSEKKVYRIPEFKYSSTDNKFTFGSVTQIQDWDGIEKVKLLFPIDYPNEGLRVIAIELDKRHEIQQLIGYVLKFDDELTSVSLKKEFNVNLYRYVPNADPLNFKSIFTKFPTEELEDHLLAVTSFPLNQNLKRRLFVYYMETPPKSKPQVCSGKDCMDFQRYLFVGEPVTYGNLTELNWHHNLTGDEKCVPMNDFIVSAATTLDDYSPDGNKFVFHLVEFSGTEYRVSKASLTNESASNKLTQIQSGSIDEMFGCVSFDTNSTKRPTEEGSGGLSVWSILGIILLIIIIICIILGLLFFFLKQRSTGDRQQTSPVVANPSDATPMTRVGTVAGTSSSAAAAPAAPLATPDTSTGLRKPPSLTDSVRSDLTLTGASSSELIKPSSEAGSETEPKN